MGEKRNAYKFLVRKPERKRPQGETRRTWVDSTKMDLVEVGLVCFRISTSEELL
jgi:hypothetical protein